MAIRQTPINSGFGAKTQASVRESEINQKGKARKLWDIEEGKGI